MSVSLVYFITGKTKITSEVIDGSLVLVKITIWILISFSCKIQLKKLKIMTLEEAKSLAQQGIKVTHQYFTSDEWMIMNNNTIQFEDGCEIDFDEWVKYKSYLKSDWSKFEE